MLRFKIRDLLWLTVVVALVAGWGVDHTKTRLDWAQFRKNERALQAAKQELDRAKMQAKTARDQKESVLRAAARFGIGPLDIEPETRIDSSLLGDDGDLH